MKTFRCKTLVAALAVAGLATACDRDSVERDAYVPPEPPAVERSTTAAGTTTPSAVTSIEESGYAHEADLTTRQSVTEADHEESIEFSGSELTAESEGKLTELVDALDAEKPVKVIVAMDDQMYENTQGQQTATSDQQPNINQQNRERYTSAFGERVETVKQFMEEQGVDVTQWQFERIEEQDLAQQRDSQESAEEIQSVRLVISASPQDGSFSAITEE
jgi:hypothetical protein